MSTHVNPMKKHKVHAEEHIEEGEGNWLVSYADMMTLLVGFFVILLSFSKVDEDKLDEVKKEAVKEFGGSYQMPYGDLASQIKKTLDAQGFGAQFSIKQTSNGVSISFLGAAFFDPGSADIKDDARKLMENLLVSLQKDSKDFQIIIEGHTDDVPISSTLHYENNWELSGVRASHVLTLFEKFGYSKLQLTAVGYGEARPVVPNRDANGVAIPANQSQNRRVVVKLIRKSESLMGKEEALPITEESHP